MPVSRPSFALLSVVLVLGCESMDAPGHPFDPAVADAAPSATATPPPTSEFAPVPGWEDAAPFEMTSEQFVANSTVPAPSGAAADGSAPLADAAVPATPAEVIPEPTTVPAAASPIAAPPLQGMGMNAGWPIRLVKAIPDAVPPRAIVGLPDGTELVVIPGAMLAAQGLVVMAIGKDQMQLAQVQANGDHATVVPMTLLALY